MSEFTQGSRLIGAHTVASTQADSAPVSVVLAVPALHQSLRLASDTLARDTVVRCDTTTRGDGTDAAAPQKR